MFSSFIVPIGAISPISSIFAIVMFFLELPICLQLDWDQWRPVGNNSIFVQKSTLHQSWSVHWVIIILGNVINRYILNIIRFYYILQYSFIMRLVNYSFILTIDGTDLYSQCTWVIRTCLVDTSYMFFHRTEQNKFRFVTSKTYRFP